MNKSKLFVWILGFLTIIIVSFFYFRSNRYYISVQERGISYKIDKWTGKTWLLRGSRQIPVVDNSVTGTSNESNGKQPNSDAAPKSLGDKVDQLVSKDQYEEALKLVNNAKGEDETDKAKLREKIHLNYGIYLEYRGPEGKSMRERMTSSLDQYIKVLRINSKNEKARSEIKQIMGIYETMPSQSPGEKILTELRSLGFEYY